MDEDPILVPLDDGAGKRNPLADVRNFGIMAHIDAGQDDRHRAHPPLLRPHPPHGRGPRRPGDDGLHEGGAGARDHDHVRRHPHDLAGLPPQHHRHARARGLHGRGGAQPARARRLRRGVRRAGRASSRSRRRSGARPTATTCRGSASSTRWTRRARTSRRASSRSARGSGAPAYPVQYPIGQGAEFRGIIDLLETEGLPLRRGLARGATSTRKTIPAELDGDGGPAPARARRGRRRDRRPAPRALPRRRGAPPRRPAPGHAQGRRAGHDRARALRLGAAQQGHPAAARRGLLLHAVSPRRPLRRGNASRHRRDDHAHVPTRPNRSPRSRSRRSPTRTAT